MAQYASQLIGKVAIEGADKAKSDLKSVGEHAKETESSFKKLKEQVARGFEFGTGMQLAQIPGNVFEGLKEQFTDTIKLAMDHQQVMAQTANVIKTMHDASGENADQIDKMAESISKVAPVSKDAVLAGENMLMTFGNIGKNVFPQTTQAVVDFANFMHMDVTEAALQVGKALNDPATGMANLQREGVRLSPALQQTVKDLEAHGNMAGAQKIILQELQREFGGSAEAAGKTFGGQLKIAQDRIEDLKTKIGTALLPILTEFLQYFEQHILPRLDDFSQWFQSQGIPKLQQFGDWFQRNGIPLLEQFGTDIGNVISWFQQGGPAVDLLRDAFLGVGAAIIGIKILDFGKDVANTVKGGIDNVKSFIDTVGKIKDKLSDVSDFFANNFSTKAKASLDDVGTTADATGTSVSGIGSAAEGNVAKVQDAAIKEETTLGETTITADATSVAVSDIGTKAEIAAGASGVGGLTGAVSKLFNLVGPAIGIGLLAEQLNIAIGMIEAGPQNSATVTGKAKHYHGPHSFASGTDYAPGGLSWVGEHGPELMNLPRGTQIFDHQTSMAMASGGGTQQTIVLSIDGVQFARVAMPYLTNAIRYSVGSVGY